MRALTEVAYAKINLALHIRRRRPDGFHDLETLFAFAEDGDVLTAVAADDLSLSIGGPFSEGLSSGADNLVLQAAEELRRLSGNSKGAALHLEKNLPVAAGLGGGSADAAAALRLLGRMWQVTVPVEVASGLGADVPACAASVTIRGEGKGDKLMPVDGSDVAGMPLLLVNPRIHCPTGPVFQAWDGIDYGPLEGWREGRNDLQPAAISLIPVIEDVINVLRSQTGAEIVRQSGSGATCFALFDRIQDRDTAQVALQNARPEWWVFPSQLR